MELTVPVLVAVIFAVVVGDRLSLSVFDALARFKALPYFMAMPGGSNSGNMLLRSEHAQSARELVVADSPVIYQHSTTADLKDLISKKFDSNYVPILDNAGTIFCATTTDLIFVNQIYFCHTSCHTSHCLTLRIKDCYCCLSDAANSRLCRPTRLDRSPERHRSPQTQSHQRQRRNQRLASRHGNVSHRGIQSQRCIFVSVFI
jgi:hypothetical protein